MSATAPPELQFQPTPVQELKRTIDELRMSCFGLAKGLGLVCPPHTAPATDGLKCFGGPDGGWTPLYALWLHWRDGMRVVDACDRWTGRSGPVVVPAEIPAPDDSTDEAAGLAVPAETAEPGADQQQRLIG